MKLKRLATLAAVGVSLLGLALLILYALNKAANGTAGF